MEYGGEVPPNLAIVFGLGRRVASLDIERESMSQTTIGSKLEERRITLERSLPLGFPISLNIESTNACNLDCFFCPRKESSKGIGLMEFGLFTKLIDECALRGPLKLINLHKDGEPMAHPRIFDMVRYIADRMAAEKFGFTSNGVLVTKDRGQRLIDSGLNKISFSIDAAMPDTYSRTKGKDRLGVVEKNVFDFLSIKPDHVEVAVKFIRMEENVDEEDAFVEKWKEHEVEIIINSYHDWSGSVRNSSLIPILPVSTYACENPFYSLSVNWNGTVSLCCVDWDSQGLVGDANCQSLQEIWTGPALRQIREFHLSGNAGCVVPCANCTYKSAENREYIGSWLMQNRERLMDY